MFFARKPGRHAAPGLEAITVWPLPGAAGTAADKGGDSVLALPKAPGTAPAGRQLPPAGLLAEAVAVFLADRRDLPEFRAAVAARGWCGLHLPAGWPMS